MALIDEIKRVKGLYIRAPLCGHEFKAAKALLFDARKALPREAAAVLEERRAALEAAKQALAKREKAIAKAAVTAKAVNIGKVVEKIASVLPGFQAKTADCRSIFEPIDFIIFQGLTTVGAVEAIHFAELKSGAAKLNEHQRQIRAAVLGGKVEFAVEDVEAKP